ncbi:MAG: bile acid:sodium symporter family protein [Bacteroidota bacterium]|jgi:BASS family bile acid:Na+ symporter
MHPVDTLQLHFNPDQMLVLNAAMAFLMFSVALDIRLEDFRRVVQFPRSIGVGILAQYLIFPLLTLAIIAVFNPPASVGLGMVLVSMCPSGNMTNFLSHFAKANVALSVTLNAIIILSASFLTPAGFLFWSAFVPDSEAVRQTFEISFSQMVIIIIELIVAPLLLGMWLNEKKPEFVAKIRPWAQRISLLVFFSILVLALLGNRDNIVNFLGFVFVLVAVHNGVALAHGYALGRLFRLPELDCRTLAFETGIHNTALGLLLIFKFFGGLGGMALIAAWYGIWDLITGMSLAWYWKKRPL